MKRRYVFSLAFFLALAGLLVFNLPPSISRAIRGTDPEPYVKFSGVWGRGRVIAVKEEKGTANVAQVKAWRHDIAEENTQDTDIYYVSYDSLKSIQVGQEVILDVIQMPDFYGAEQTIIVARPR